MTRTLLILMWKHLTVRMRRFLHTPLEIISPTLIFILLFLLKSSIIPVSKFDPPHEDVVSIKDPVLLTSLGSPTKVFYHPASSAASKLMEQVKVKLQEHKQSPGSSRTVEITSFSNISQVNDMMVEILSGYHAIVLFENVSDAGLPNQLQYTIRMKEDFKTSLYKSLDGTVGSHERFGDSYHAFVGLQWAIDTTYIAMRSEHPVDQRLYLQEFPSLSKNEDVVRDAICKFMMILCWLSLTLTFVFLMTRLLEERSTGVQELVKMVGVSTNTLAVSHFLNSLPAGLAYTAVGTALLTASEPPYLAHTSGALVFIALALHFLTVAGLAFACSYIVKSSEYTATLSVFAHVVLWLPARLLTERQLPAALATLTGLLPHVPLHWFWIEVGSLEKYGEGLSFSDIAKHHSNSGGTVLMSFVFMLIQATLFFLVSWYLSLVRPGKYGQALPWNFLFKAQYWSAAVEPDEAPEDSAALERDPLYFEDAPADTELGIKIVNVSKCYPKNRALSNLSLDVYKGEITVLLGHNGAGKTTLISIITGMTAATTGQVFVGGRDTRTSMSEIRRELGLCPQHNLNFPDLTVLEHVIFFTWLKGGTYSEAKSSSVKLLNQLGLSNKENSKPAELSGGMKRRLQLACALAGDAKVLVLDEPTAGLDVETRRGLWDLLLSLRGSRTLVISTHFMEEADALGDRVAALHAGRLACHATTMHLKRAVGTGYRLTFTTIGEPKEPDVTSVIRSLVPDAQVTEKTCSSLSYSLPAACCSRFPDLFNQLEERRSMLGIDSIGVGRTTLEEVFLKLCSDMDTSYKDDSSETVLPESDRTFNALTGIRLYMRQVGALMLRQIRYLMTQKTAFLILQVILPIVSICSMTHFSNMQLLIAGDPSTNPALELTTRLYKESDLRALYHSDLNTNDIKDRLKPLTLVETDDIVNTVRQAAVNNVYEYSKYLFGVEVNNTDAKVLYTTVYRHALPVTVNMLTNLLATARLGAPYPAITTYNHPIDAHKWVNPYKDIQLEHTKDNFILRIYAMFIIFIAMSVLANVVTLPCKERLSSTRRIHIMAGCSPELYWLSTLLFHAALYTLVLVLPIVIAAAAIDNDDTINQPCALWAMFVVLMVGVVSLLPFVYAVTMVFAERVASVVFVVMIVVFGLITPLAKYGNDWTAGVAEAANYLVPLHAFSAAFAAVTGVAAENARHRDELQSYFKLGKDEVGSQLIILAVQFFVYSVLLVVSERGLFNVLHDRLYNWSYSPGRADRDGMVRAERAYVEKAIDLPKQQIADAMLADDLHKNYKFIFRKSCNAVKGVSFSVKKGECFGLLGVNGAGKSTTFKMLTLQEHATRGRVYCNGYFAKRTTDSYLNTLGYCPQFLGVDEFLTGRQNLELVLALRGLDAPSAAAEADYWIRLVGLEKHAAVRVGAYSGGCARRVSCACALAPRAPLALLDEPTAGVDVAARRRLWAALHHQKRQGRSMVITSHSMDEMEALCSRIAILSGGGVRALGGAAALRAQHAAGHAVLLKLRAPARAEHAHHAHHEHLAGDEVDTGKNEVDRLKSELRQKFDCTLRDEHKTMLHYHIKDTLRYSELFSRIENLKSSFPQLIEDYSVTETTLEEVFLAFAKENSAEGPTAV